MSRSGRVSRSSSARSSVAARHCARSRRDRGERPRGRAQLLDALRELGPRRDGEVEIAPRRAQRLVDGRQHPPQPGAAVRREELEPLRVVSGEELVERRAERLRAETAPCVVELAEARVEAGRERIRPQQPGAEAVDRRDPRAVELAGEVVPPTLGERRADPRPQLAGGAARVRDDEDRVDVEAAVEDRADDALDEHGRLPGAGAGRDEDLARRLDRRALLLVERVPAHARSTRHIGQRSHHAGHSPSRGSWRTSPSRIRSATAAAVARADSTTPQKSSSR